MAKADLPPIQPPVKWLNDPELSRHVQDLYFSLHQLYVRSGGGDDNFNEITLDLNSLTLRVEALENLVPVVYDLSADRTTTGNELITANGYTVTLNDEPIDGEFVTVKTVSNKSIVYGNGRQVEGRSSIRTGLIGESLDFWYSQSQDAWFIGK